MRFRLLLIMPLLTMTLQYLNFQWIGFIKLNESAMEPGFPQGQLFRHSAYPYGILRPFHQNAKDNRFSFKTPERGDVVSLWNPQSEENSPFMNFLRMPIEVASLGIVLPENQKRQIRRVVGLPGETIKIINRQIYIDDRLFTPSFNQSFSDVRILDINASARDNLREIYIPTDHVFVLSDNWDFTSDSRNYGPVPMYKIASKIIN